MRAAPRLLLLALLGALLLSCRPPTYDSAHRDARNAGPFWEREEQRD